MCVVAPKETRFFAIAKDVSRFLCSWARFRR